MTSKHGRLVGKKPKNKSTYIYLWGLGNPKGPMLRQGWCYRCQSEHLWEEPCIQRQSY